MVITVGKVVLVVPKQPETVLRGQAVRVEHLAVVVVVVDMLT
jgi:hypothetical protein